MAFGQELKEFVSSFQAGYQMVDSKEEKEEKRAKRKREAEAHEWSREESLYNRDFNREKFDYGVNRDKVGDQQWQDTHKFRTGEFEWRKEDAEQDRIRADEKYEHGVRVDQRDFELRKEALKEGYYTPDAAVPDEFREYVNPPATAIPEDASATAEPIAYHSGSSRTPATLVSNESGGRWDAQNDAVGAGGQKGHFGQLQFGHARLSEAKRAGVIPASMTPEQFLNSPRAQKAAENWHFADIDRQAAKLGLTSYIGKVVGGVPITPDAIRAMAHLGGINGAKRFILSGGRYNPADENGTSLRDYGIRHGGARRKKSVNAAAGGMITALPVDDEDEEEAPQQHVLPASGILEQPEAGKPSGAGSPGEVRRGSDGKSYMYAETTGMAGATGPQGWIEYNGEGGAIPEDVPTPTPRPAYEGVAQGQEEEPTDDPYELGRRAVRDGINNAMKMGQMDAETVINDPEIQKRRNDAIRGYGAAPAQLIKQAQDLIDPEKKMSPTERNLKSIGKVYSFFMERGEYDKAQEAATSMVQAHMRESQQFLALAQAAAEKGDHANAAKAAVAAYANIPNGRDLQIEEKDGKYHVTVTDERTGKTVTDQLVTPDEMTAAAMGFSPATFYEELLAAAGMPAEEVEGGTFESRETARENVSGYMDEAYPPEQDPFIDQHREPLSDIAGAIATIDGNNISTSAAARFVGDMVTGVRIEQGEDGNLTFVRPFTAKKMPGGKVYEVTSRGGETVKMDASEYNALTTILEKRADELEAEALRVKDDEASGSSVREYLRQGVDALRQVSPPARGGVPQEAPAAIPEDGPLPMTGGFSLPRIKREAAPEDPSYVPEPWGHGRAKR